MIFKEKKIVLVGWSTGTPVSLNFMKNYPDIKIVGLVSVAGFVNNTGRELNDKVVPYFLNIVNPQDNFGEVISGLDGIYRSTSFKPLSDELYAFFLGNSVMAPYEYSISAVVPYSLMEFYITLNIPTLHIIGEHDIITDMNIN
ncbi:hypothetical protein C1645_836656 [Glomus cerebriforme]|uniref:Uncharacterized protein n=1 Tax=Glomus cerebriforme TaxID=658196 RepID=A0A397S5I3_9GLOM|nr:hypothetical protein C1645_836656 [Glomus cerebriforme]